MAEHPEGGFQPARLFPITGAGRTVDEERHTCSILLAVMRHVAEFGRALTQPLGAPAGTVETFIECSYPLNGHRARPDGLIKVAGRGKRVWRALVELKTSTNVLRKSQIEDYLDVAAEQGIDAVLTISAELPPFADGHPVDVDGKKLKSVQLYHRSWSEIRTEVLLEINRRQVSDPDQARILEEFLRYLASERSGADQFDDMGPSWVKVRNALHESHPGDADLDDYRDVAIRFSQLVSYAAMRQTQRIGVEVRPVIERALRTDAKLAIDQAAEQLRRRSRLVGAITVPGAVNPLRLTVNLSSLYAECSVTIDVPTNHRPPGRVKWLTDQLKSPPSNLLIRAHVAHARRPGPNRQFGNVMGNPEAVLEDRRADVRRLTLSLGHQVGSRRKAGPNGSFIDGVVSLVDQFYEDVVQHLERPRRRAPQVLRPQDNPTSDTNSASTT